MLRCKHVADALAVHRYWDLPWYKRWGMRMHVGLCIMCGRYHRHVMVMQDMAKNFTAQDTSDTLGENVCLSDEAKHRIADAVKAAE